MALDLLLTARLLPSAAARQAKAHGNGYTFSKKHQMRRAAAELTQSSIPYNHFYKWKGTASKNAHFYTSFS